MSVTFVLDCNSQKKDPGWFRRFDGTHMRNDEILLCQQHAERDKREVYEYSARVRVYAWLRTFTYMRLSTLTPRSSGNCCLHFSRNVAMSSPFLH